MIVKLLVQEIPSEQLAENWYFVSDLSYMEFRGDYSIKITVKNVHSVGFIKDVTCLVLNKMHVVGEDVIQKD